MAPCGEVARLHRGWAPPVPETKKPPPKLTKPPPKLTLERLAPPTPPARDALRELPRGAAGGSWSRINDACACRALLLCRALFITDGHQGLQEVEASSGPTKAMLPHTFSLKAAAIETCYLNARAAMGRRTHRGGHHTTAAARSPRSLHATRSNILRRCWNTFRLRRRLLARSRIPGIVREVAAQAEKRLSAPEDLAARLWTGQGQ